METAEAETAPPSDILTSMEVEEEPKSAQITPPSLAESKEEPKLNPNTHPTQTPNPIPNPDQNPPNIPPSPLPPASLPNATKKRSLDQNGHIENSRYFKMRAVLKELRPHFIEVLRTPIIQNCKAAQVIHEQMNLLMDLYKEMTAETISSRNCNNMPEGHFSNEVRDGQKPIEPHQDVRRVDQPPGDRVFVKASEEKPFLSGNLSGKQIQGTYIVGGSAFGWNFITYPGTKTVYYGRTKEMFRSANVDIVPE